MSIVDKGVSVEKVAPILEPIVEIDAAKMKMVREAVAIGASFKEICYYSDIREKDLEAFLRQHPDISYELDLLSTRPLLRARQTLDKAIGDDPAYALRYLERKRPEEFAPSSTVRTQHTVQHKLDPEAEAKMTELSQNLDAALRKKLIQPLEGADREAGDEVDQHLGGGLPDQDGNGSPA